MKNVASCNLTNDNGNGKDKDQCKMANVMSCHIMTNVKWQISCYDGASSKRTSRGSGQMKRLDIVMILSHCHQLVMSCQIVMNLSYCHELAMVSS